MLKGIVWFGEIEFGDFTKGKDTFPCAIVHEIQEHKFMDEEEADNYMAEHGFSGYLFPHVFQGEIYYSKEIGDEH